MDFSTDAATESAFFTPHDDVAARPDDWVELKGGCSLGTRKWLFFRRKYLVERILGSVLLVLASPLILLLIGIVRITSSGPGLYRQKRVGFRGREFEILKIRSMVQDAERDGCPVWCKKQDPRVTKLGKFLRTVHLDELPQLLNVARGDMALVGPRPERPEIIASLREQIPGYERRLSVMPGVTGLAQINLPPDESIEDVRRKQQLDLRYIAEANAWLDLRMMVATTMRMFGLPGQFVTSALGLYRGTQLAVEARPEERWVELGSREFEPNRQERYAGALAEVS